MLALNLDFDSPSFDFLALRESAQCARGHERAVLLKSRNFTVVGQSFVKTVADRHGHAAYRNKHY